MKTMHNWSESFNHGADVFLAVEAESELHGLVLMNKVFFF